MSRFKKLLTVLAVLLGGVGGSFALAAPAQAAASDCPTGGYVCFWVDKNFSGNMYKWTWSQVHAATGSCVTFSSGIDNKTSSILSTMSSIGNAMTFFDGYGGGANVAKNGTFSDNDFSNATGGWPGGWNDKISSICAF